MISLEAATRTCKVDTASAARIESDRFLNPTNVVCPNWTGKDLAGRQVSADSFYTKRAGCNSAADRVIVENMLRPQYMEYINLDAKGIRGELYKNNMYYQNAGELTSQMEFAETQAGHFGGVFSPGSNEATCSYGAYDEGVRQMNNQIKANRQKPAGRSCGARFVRHGGPTQPSVREGYMEAPQSFTRTNTALTNGFRSCRFREASGF